MTQLHLTNSTDLALADPNHWANNSELIERAIKAVWKDLEVKAGPRASSSPDLLGYTCASRDKSTSFVQIALLGQRPKNSRGRLVFEKGELSRSKHLGAEKYVYDIFYAYKQSEKKLPPASEFGDADLRLLILGQVPNEKCSHELAGGQMDMTLLKRLLEQDFGFGRYREICLYLCSEDVFFKWSAERGWERCD